VTYTAILVVFLILCVASGVSCATQAERARIAATVAAAMVIAQLALLVAQ
jgi:hypothetical protein